ncbi:MAG: DUF190 domain-containing protein [Thermomicrobiales bacterium]|nr:DUF190 domain-containing protein [Thermomicrobiales bacterium]
MTHSPRIGLLRIHVRARDYVHHEGKWWHKVIKRDLSHQLVRWAHEDGFDGAISYRSHLGFVGHGPIIDDLAGESRNPHTIIVVEIAGEEQRLRSFIEHHRAMLTHAHVQFLSVENWSLHHGHVRRTGGHNDKS